MPGLCSFCVAAACLCAWFTLVSFCSVLDRFADVLGGCPFRRCWTFCEREAEECIVQTSRNPWSTWKSPPPFSSFQLLLQSPGALQRLARVSWRRVSRDVNDGQQWRVPVQHQRVQCAVQCTAYSRASCFLFFLFSSSPSPSLAHFPLSQTIAAKIGKPVSELVKLNANENVYGAPESVLKELSKSVWLHMLLDPTLHWWTDASCFRFQKKKKKKKVTQTTKKNLK